MRKCVAERVRDIVYNSEYANNLSDIMGRQKKYTSGDIAKILNLKRDRLKEWRLGGYIKPSIKVSTGQGSPDHYSHNDLIRLFVFITLRRYGFGRAIICSVIGLITDEVVDDTWAIGIVGGNENSEVVVEFYEDQSQLLSIMHEAVMVVVICSLKEVVNRITNIM